MRALVIDDEQLVLEGLEALLQVSLPDLTLDKTAHLATALRLAASVRYQLVLLDWNLIDVDGSAIDGRGVVRALGASGSQAPIVVVSGDEREDWRQRILELRLSGFVPKTAGRSTLIDAIHVALRGGVFLPDDAARRPHATAPRQAPPTDPRERFPDLTDRQADVFRVMVRGQSDKQIARELGISESTVKTHVRSILALVGVERRGQAVFKLTGQAPGA